MTAPQPITYTIQTAEVLRDSNGEVVGLGDLATVYAGSTQVVGLDFTSDDGAIVLSAGGDLWSVDLTNLGRDAAHEHEREGDVAALLARGLRGSPTSSGPPGRPTATAG